MCIICNLPPNDPAGDRFLTDFDASRKAMSAAANSMLEAAKVAITPEHRRRYDSMHKKMRHLMREWNAIEQLRETGSTGDKG